MLQCLKLIDVMLHCLLEYLILLTFELVTQSLIMLTLQFVLLIFRPLHFLLRLPNFLTWLLVC